MIDYKTWGAEVIDEQSHKQMRDACQLPVAVKAALMPDAHLGYGVPIGAVVGMKDALNPGAVGVDIGCRMSMSIFEIEPATINTRLHRLPKCLEEQHLLRRGRGERRPS